MRTSTILLKAYQKETNALAYEGRAEGSFTDDEVDLLRSYQDESLKLKACRLVRQGLPDLTTVTVDASGFQFVFSAFDWEDVFAALHLARPFILSKEPASFDRVSGLLNRRFENDFFRKDIKRIQRHFVGGHYQQYIQIESNGIDVFGEDTFKLWVNARQYHRDHQKIKVIQELDASFGRDTADTLLALHFSAKVEAIITLSSTVERVLGNLETAD